MTRILLDRNFRFETELVLAPAPDPQDAEENDAENGRLVMSRTAGAAAIRSCRGNANSVEALRRAYAMRHRNAQLARINDATIVERLAGSAAYGHIHVVAVQRSLASGMGTIDPPKPKPKPTPPKPKPKNDHWIEFVVEDKAKNRIGKLKYELMPPSGVLKGGELNEQGSVKLEGKPAGTYELRIGTVNAAGWEIPPEEPAK